MSCAERATALCEAVAHACRIRLRPILMTSLATIVGLLPMALKLETRKRSLRAARSRHHRRPAASSIILTIFVVPPQRTC